MRVEPIFKEGDYITNRHSGDLAIVKGVTKKGYYQFKAYYGKMLGELKDVNDKGYEFFPIMAAIRYDVDPLLKKIQEMLSKLPPIAKFEPEPAPVVTVEDFDDHTVTVKNVNGVYVVEADWLLQVMRGINFDDYESLNYFQKVLVNGGVIEALRQKGVQDGDTVSIYDVEFDFME